MTVLQREINQESIAAERTRKITLGVLVVLATFLILWWSFDSFQLWNEQGKELSIKESELVEIGNEFVILEQRQQELYLPTEIEWLARQNFGLIRPGEEAFAVPPPAPAPVRLPSVWPFTHLAEAIGG
ncbi:MAG: hypothetical protein CL454_02340 [Acidimicrobiaceae bacterium]|nr:hypothetical protein [Acidimicrobiaceae bacterium]MBA4810892.1 hypothetical protein [Acidimicrobiales bacterium]MBC83673.1 hypothetical protein [Acidimicrobiaceae bacterium]OUV00346.1 MAG: hypothetical protein CBC37_05020 [Acidimicrobiaceae bacterium TMED77]|tara:strand:+ start:587 stop:970 length:384 start_codon:yes stop_codon:yes gene_type:complete